MTLVPKEASKQVDEGGADVAAEQADLQVRANCACGKNWVDGTHSYVLGCAFALRH